MPKIKDFVNSRLDFSIFKSIKSGVLESDGSIITIFQSHIPNHWLGRWILSSWRQKIFMMSEMTFSWLVKRWERLSFFLRVFPWRDLLYSFTTERSTAVILGAEYLCFWRRWPDFTLGSIYYQVSWGSGWPQSSKRGVESRFSFLYVENLRGWGAMHIWIIRGPSGTRVFSLEGFGHI